MSSEPVAVARTALLADDPPRSETKVCKNPLSVGAALLELAPVLEPAAGSSRLTSDWKSDCSLDNGLLGVACVLLVAAAVVADALVAVLGLLVAAAAAVPALALALAVPVGEVEDAVPEVEGAEVEAAAAEAVDGLVDAAEASEESRLCSFCTSPLPSPLP